ncbi:MAG TPA: hypothetical protein VFZ67_02435 [Nitrososphaera sp.]
MTQLTFEDIARMVEYIPIAGTLPNSGRLIEGETMDSNFPIREIDSFASKLDLPRKGSISLRDIVKIFSLYLKDANWEVLVNKQRSSQLGEMGCTYPTQYLLFDYCLAALDEDYLNARLYLAHSFHILGLHKPLNLLLSVVVNEEEQQLLKDKDVREFLALLAKVSEPRNAHTYINTYGDEFSRRYRIYIEELNKLQSQRKTQNL